MVYWQGRDGWKFELQQTRKALLAEKGLENKGANQHTPELDFFRFVDRCCLETGIGKNGFLA